MSTLGDNGVRIRAPFTGEELWQFFLAHPNILIATVLFIIFLQRFPISKTRARGLVPLHQEIIEGHEPIIAAGHDRIPPLMDTRPPLALGGKEATPPLSDGGLVSFNVPCSTASSCFLDRQNGQNALTLPFAMPSK